MLGRLQYVSTKTYIVRRLLTGCEDPMDKLGIFRVTIVLALRARLSQHEQSKSLWTANLR